MERDSREKAQEARMPVGKYLRLLRLLRLFAAKTNSSEREVY